MKSLFLALTFVGLCLAGNPDFSVNVGGSNPPVTNPQVMGFNILDGPYKHVIILSIDGLHHVDLETYVGLKPKSALAELTEHAVWYKNVHASMPTDSFPGTAALYTGATPRTHGLWYDNTWDRTYYTFSAGCSGPIGFNVVCDESIDIDSTKIDGGGGFDLRNLPYQKTAWGSCEVLLPHNLLRSKTIFEVIRESGGMTKLTDKHPAYEIFNGPSGTGVYETYFPEIASVPVEVPSTEGYDSLHWAALYNWTAGNFQNGTKDPGGVPQLYTSNFQSVSVAQKNFGYKLGSTSSKPIFTKELLGALDFTDQHLDALIDALKKAGTYQETLLIVTAKHGQSPIDPSLSKKISPSSIQAASSVQFAQVTADDGAYIWLVDATLANVNKAKADLLAAATTLGIARILASNEIYQNGFGDPKFDPRVPDLVIVTKPGIIYAKPTAVKIAEHGGINDDDLTVALFVHNPKLDKKGVMERVYTRQVAVTAVKALGGDIEQLDGAMYDGTSVLPGLKLE